MRKNELIARLTAIEGDPLILIDIDGRMTDDILPSARVADEKLLANMHENATERPNVGDPIILI